MTTVIRFLPAPSTQAVYRIVLLPTLPYSRVLKRCIVEYYFQLFPTLSNSDAHFCVLGQAVIGEYDSLLDDEYRAWSFFIPGTASGDN